MLQNWAEVLRTSNLRAGRRMDFLSRWLIITRASVFSMTATSAIIGGLLAAGAGDFNLGPFLLAFVGLVLSHAANNMMNDYFDLEGGVDTEEYIRAQYAPHPILSGMVSRLGLLAAIGLVNLVDLAIAIYLTYLRGWPVLVFVGLGFFISLFYVAPPIRLKHHGLGEPGVFAVWGPLMIGGTYYVTAGHVPWWVFLASIPYALLVTTVLIGKHIDKYDADRAKGIHTLVVLVGRERSIALNKALMAGFYPVVLALVAIGVLPVWTAAVLLTIPRLRAVLRVYSSPKPETAPPNYPIWPLWYVAWSFVLNRPVGFLFIAGLLIGAVLPVHFPRPF